MPTAFSFLRSAIKLQTETAIEGMSVNWKKIPTVREGETLPKIDLVSGEDWLEPFTAEDDLAWLGHYIVHCIYIREANNKALFNDLLEDNRQVLKKSLLDIISIQTKLDLLSGNVVTLDDVKISRRKIHNLSTLLKGYDYMPLTFEYILQESRTGSV